MIGACIVAVICIIYYSFKGDDADEYLTTHGDS